jgi:hypothetical protein
MNEDGTIDLTEGRDKHSELFTFCRDKCTEMYPGKTTRAGEHDYEFNPKQFEACSMGCMINGC